MIGPTARSAAVAAVETVINRALALDPATRIRCAALEGKVFHLECTRPALQLFVLPQRDRIQLAAQWEGEVDAGLSGSAGDFAELLTSSDPAATLINGPLSVRGDSQALQRLQHIVTDLDIDWEAPLARLFGDVAGHQLGNALRGAHRFLLQAGRNLGRQLRDYVRDESGWLAPRWQVETFCADVAELARRSEQLKQRAAQLQRLAQQRRPLH